MIMCCQTVSYLARSGVVGGSTLEAPTQNYSTLLETIIDTMYEQNTHYFTIKKIILRNYYYDHTTNYNITCYSKIVIS